MARLAGKVALVTGGASGVGRAVAALGRDVSMLAALAQQVSGETE